MGLLDRFKKKTKEAPKEKGQREPAKKQADEKKFEAVVTPEGKLVKTPKKEGASKKQKPKKDDTGDAYRVLIRPLVTEKSSSLGALNQYAFEVAPQTNKIEVARAIRNVYGVTPMAINIMNVSGKYVRYGRTEGRTKHWKKAIVTLPEGQKIDIQEGLT